MNEMMNRSAAHGRKLRNSIMAWREAGYAALRAKAADAFDDRVSETIYDAEDERAAVDLVLGRMAHGAG
jgi:hypothetical protein